MSTATLNFVGTHLLRRLSSENGFDGRLTLDLPRSTFHDPGETATGDEETSSSFEPPTRVLLTRDSRGDRRGDFGGRDMVQEDGSGRLQRKVS